MATKGCYDPAVEGGPSDERLVSALVSVLGGDERVAAAWVFGSRARGDAGPGSDLDVAVLASSDLNATERAALGLELIGRVSDAVADLVPAVGEGRDRADVVVLQDADPLLVRSALTEGRLLSERNRDARIGFEVAAMDRWVIADRLAAEYRRARARRYGVTLR